MKIAFIGGGVMAEAMIKGILGRGLARPQDIVVSDISEKRRSLLGQVYGVGTASDNRRAVEGSEIVILAVKPQNLDEVLKDLSGLTRGRLVLSIIARASIAALSRGLGNDLVVRAMPNVGAQVGEGVTVWTASSPVSQPQKETARAIWGALGREIYVEQEKYLDMATAVSGSGPAYIFLVIEALIDAAVHIGWSREMARELVVQTVLSSVRLMQETGKHPAELRNMVTSPAGTTTEGLLQLEKGGVRALFVQAVIAAYEKSKIFIIGAE